MSASLTPGTCAHGTNTVEGKLKGFDTLVNLVLDECVEYMRGDVTVCEKWNGQRERECVVYCCACGCQLTGDGNVVLTYRSTLFTYTARADIDDPYKLTDEKRQLGLIVCRGTGCNSNTCKIFKICLSLYLNCENFCSRYISLSM